MISVIVGLVFVILGMFGVTRWFPDFLIVAKGLGSVSVLLGGLVAVITGFSSIQTRRRSNVQKK